MVRPFSTLVLLVLAFVLPARAAEPELTPEPAAGPPALPCHRYEEIRKELDTHYAEAPVSLGLQTNGNMLQVFASRERRTWTIVSTSPTGLACIVAAGEGWEQDALDEGA